MIAIDSNILIYAHRDDAPLNAKAYAAVKRLIESGEAWLLTWQNVHEFIAVVTNPRVYRPPTTLVHAIQQVEDWMASPGVMLAAEVPGYWSHFKRLAVACGVKGGGIYDVRLAAVSLSHGVNEILTNDSDFEKLEFIRVRSL